MMAAAAMAVLHAAAAQTPVPLLTAYDRLVVFLDGRFEDLEARKPQAIFQNGDRLAYITDGGDFKLYENGRVTVLQRGETVEVKGSRHLLAWKVGPSLRIPKDDGAETLCRGTGAFSVQDSLIVYHDQLEQTLKVFWRNRVMPVADVLVAGEGPQWVAGTNTLLFFDRDARRVWLFYRGDVKVLCSGADVARVAPGGDIVGFMDDRDDTFRVFDRGETIDLEPFAPISFRAGSGVMAYVTNGGAFKCYKDHQVWPLLDFAPTDYWVQDSVVLFLDQGMLKTFTGNGVEVIERYVPEQWSVSGGLVAYLDLNRTLRTYRNGVRTVVSKEAGIKWFDLYPGAIAYRSNSGAAKVWWRDKLYERY